MSERRYRRFWGADPRRDVDDELAFHLAMRAEEFRRAGMSDHEAEEATMQRFGDVKEIRSEVEDIAVKRHARRRRAWHMDAFRQDIRFALRTLRANPGYAVVVALTLALGLGANAAVFSVAYGVLLRPLPYRDADRIVRLWSKNERANLPTFSVSPDDYRDWRDQAHTLTAVAAFERRRDATLATRDEPQHVAITGVTPNIFAVLDATPVRGRTLGVADAQPGAPPVVVMSYGLWTSTYGADSSIVGRAISVDGVQYTVVGVMPRGWGLPNSDAAVFTPISLDGKPDQRGNRYLRVLGRLAPGATTTQALTELTGITERAYRAYPDKFAGWGVAVWTLSENVIGTSFQRATWLLVGVVAFVLLIACANAANLQLARAAAREREIAVRVALGASRGRIALQLLTESLTISAIAGVLGLALAYGGVALLRAFGTTMVPRLEDVKLDAPVLAYTALIALGSGVLFGLAPALRASRASVGEVLKGGRGPGASSVGSGLRGTLVVAEIALSLVLLIGAGLLMRSFARIQAVDLGFDERNLVLSPIELPSSSYPTPEATSSYFADVLARTSATPGVESAALVSSAPFAGLSPGMVFLPAGDEVPPGAQAPNADYRHVSSGYFRTMGIHLLRGRDIQPTDRDGAPLVTVISAALAKRYFANVDPIGRQIRVADLERGPVLTIVGIVDDVRYQSLETETRPYMYFSWHASPQRTMAIVARSKSPGAAASLRAAVAAIDRRLPAPTVVAMDDLVKQVMSTRRFALVLFGVFAATALVLAVIGLYGVLSYLVRQRAHELGIRIALGASSPRVIGLIVFGALRLTVVGVAVGLLGARWLTASLGSLLFGVSATDTLTFVALALLITAVSIAASVVPALRATRADPMLALRGEA